MSRHRNSLGDPLLRLALYTLPASFRRDYGAQILSFHRQRLRDADSPWSVFAIWLCAMIDLFWYALMERISDIKSITQRTTPTYYTSRAESPGTPITSQASWKDRCMNFIREFKYAVRGLIQTPGFALAFVVTLGLGIGANTAIFSVVSGVLLRPLPHDGGDRIVYLEQDMAESALPNVTFSVPEIRDYRAAATTLSGVAEFSALTFTMLTNDEPWRIRSAIVSGNYFDVMGLDPVLGRSMSEADDPETASPVMMLTYDFWHRAFGGDSSVVGETVRMNGRTIDIIGVLEPVPDYPERIDVFVNTVSSPHHMSASMGHDRQHRMTQVFARLAPGQTPVSADVELDAIAHRLVGEYPETFVDGAAPGVTVTPLKQALTSNARLTLLVLLVAAGFVLVIACANVANLTLTRGIRRDRELTVRAVLGARRGNLRRLLLIENVILSLLGAALGLVLATAGIGLLIAYAARFTPRASEIVMDGWVLTFTVVIAVGAALLFAFVPRLPDQQRLGTATARVSTRTTGSVAGRRTQRGLVIAQLAVSFVLLIGAGLFMKTLINLQSIDPGFDTDNVLTMEVPARGAGRTGAQVLAYYATLEERVVALPGVTGFAVASMIPLSSTPFLFEVGVEGHQVEPARRQPQANFRAATPGYFRTIGTPILRGRPFDGTDNAESAKVVVINQTMADYYFPTQDPIGRRLRWTDPQFQFIGVGDEWRTIVGVVADTRDFALDELPLHSVFQPFAQESWSGALLIRTSGSPTALAPSVVRVVRDLNANQPIENIKTLGQLRAEATAPKRLNATLIGAFAVLAVIIAAVGVSSVLAFSVSRRTNEFGIRLSLGADQRRLLGMILKEGGVLLVVGLAIGGALALGVSRFVSGLLFEVQSTDPVTFISVGAVLAAVAFVASFAPAWHASRVEPVKALRAD